MTRTSFAGGIFCEVTGQTLGQAQQAYRILYA
jgi:hypothetical protein